MNRRPLFCSVIVPAHNAAHLLPQSLGALVASDFPRERFELILADDGSTDDTARVAGRYADTIVRLPGRPHGPAYARNRAFEVSRGDVIIFIDADVVVHPDTVRRFVEYFEQHADVGAVFGSYDDRPPAPGMMSQYRNLLHHYTHQRNAGEADTFWAGAGAIRRHVFAEAGMYDEWHYGRPQIEDIELGGRIRGLGSRIMLVPEIQVTHLKQWTFWGVVRTDLTDRGIPWARLLAHRGAVMSSKTLNVRTVEKLYTVFVWMSVITLLTTVWHRSTTLYALAAVALSAVLLGNLPLWRFFARVRGVWFALRVVPVHLLYYLMNGVSFAGGLLLQQLVGPPIPDPTTEAYAEVGVQRWPPVPSRHGRSSWRPDDE